MICKDYVCLSCVDGSCPMANSDEYAERGYDVVHSCDECYCYKGCEGRDLYGTEYCDGEIKKESAKNDT